MKGLETIQLNKMSAVKIIKEFGQPEFFSQDKLRRSLKRIGANDEIIAEVVQEISSQLKEGMTTRQIYQQAFDLMKRYSAPHAARYKLKQAINELGPSGFPFELFVAELLKYEEYQTQTGIVVEGHCVKHEIDVIAEKREHHFMIECKFHNSQGIHCDVKVPLYIQSRFLDVERRWKEWPGHEKKFHQAWIVTNTRFTVDAISYGTCMGLHLISWDYPAKSSLRDRINASGMHPLTCLTNLTDQEKKLLLEMDIVLYKQLCQQPELLRNVGIQNEERINNVLSEGIEVCMQFGHDENEVSKFSI